MRPISKPKVAPPKTLADALEMGLRDLRAVERSTKTYVVRMMVYHEPYDGKCQVCFAGSVMAKTCGADPERFVGSNAFGPKWQRVFWALDCLRAGNVQLASSEFGLRTVVRSRAVPGYALDREGWWKAMRQLLKELKAEQAARK